MLNKGIIDLSDSPYNATVWVISKKLSASGKKKRRIVIDFRKQNEQTDYDAYLLSNTDEILQHLGNTKFFSILDLFSVLYRIPMKLIDKMNG